MCLNSQLTKAFMMALGSLVLVCELAYSQSVPIHRLPSGHFTVDVLVNNDTPLTFVLDTGASHTAIAGYHADAMGFVSTWTRYDRVQALTDRFEAERFLIERLQIPGRDAVVVNSVVVPIVPGEESEVAGLLGADAMPSDVYELDFANGVVTFDVEPPTHTDGLFDDELNLLIGSASIDGQINRINVMIDSGSARTFVNTRLRHRLSEYSGGYAYSMVAGVSGRLTRNEPELIPMRNLRIGSLCATRVYALSADLDIFHALGWSHQPSMIIGTDVLERASVTVDQEAGVFEISPSGNGRSCGAERIQRQAASN